MIKFANETANTKYKKLSSLHYCAKAKTHYCDPTRLCRRPGSPTKSGPVADLSGLVTDFSGIFGSQTWSVQSQHGRIVLSGRRQVWSGRSSGI